MITIEIPEWVIAIIGTIISWACLIAVLKYYDIHDDLIKVKCKKLWYNWRYPYGATGNIKVATKLSSARKYMAERREYASSIVDNPRRDYVFYVDNDAMAMHIDMIDAYVARDTTVHFRFRKKQDLVQFMVRWA